MKVLTYVWWVFIKGHSPSYPEGCDLFRSRFHLQLTGPSGGPFIEQSLIPTVAEKVLPAVRMSRARDRGRRPVSLRHGLRLLGRWSGQGSGRGKASTPTPLRSRSPRKGPTGVLEGSVPS